MALEAFQSEQTLSELAARFDLHPNMIAQWTRQTIEGMAENITTPIEEEYA